MMTAGMGAVVRVSLVVVAVLTSLGVTAAPAPAGEPTATVKAREAFFGASNVDRAGRVRRDRVIVSWFGISSLAVSLKGRVVLLDTFINDTATPDCTGPSPKPPSGYVPAGYDQLAALRPAAVFIGHEHSDHECRTGELLARTRATLVGLPQACDLARRQAREYAGRAVRIRCARTLAAGSPFGAKRTIAPLGAGVPVTVVRNLHSGPASQQPRNGGGAEAVLFRFAVGHLSFEWNDTNGPMREHAPRLLRTLRGLPATDVVFGASLGLNIGEDGFRDAVDYPEALRAKRYYPLHHDTLANAGSSRVFRPMLQREFNSRPSLTTNLHWLQDPTAYLRPIVLNPSARRWR